MSHTVGVLTEIVWGMGLGGGKSLLSFCCHITVAWMTYERLLF